MKTDAISGHERALIITQLRERGKWEGVRMGANVQLVRFNAKSGTVVCYSVAFGSHTMVSARASSVYDAVTDINAVISRGKECRPLAGREPDPHRVGMQKLVRRDDRSEAEPSLFSVEA